MATQYGGITWGTAKYGGDSGWGVKVGIQYLWTYPSGGASPTGSDTTVTVWPRYWVWPQVETTEGSNSPSYSGDFGSGPNPASFDALAAGGSWATSRQTLVGSSSSVTVSLAYGSTSTKSQTWSVNVTNMGEVRPSATATFTVPARPYAAPAAPSAGAAGLPTLSGSTWSSALSWTLTSTSPAPVQQVKVYRWDSTRADASYLLVATLGAVASYLDTGLAADRRYGWAVQAVNTGGSSAWHYFGDRYTAPASPTSHTAARSGSGIAGSFVTNSTVSPAFEVWDSADGGSTWTKALDIAAATRTAGSTVSYTLSGINQAVPHLLRVRAVIGGQSSGWATIPAAVQDVRMRVPVSPSVTTHEVVVVPVAAHTRAPQVCAVSVHVSPILRGVMTLYGEPLPTRRIGLYLGTRSLTVPLNHEFGYLASNKSISDWVGSLPAPKVLVRLTATGNRQPRPRNVRSAAMRVAPRFAPQIAARLVVVRHQRPPLRRVAIACSSIGYGLKRP